MVDFQRDVIEASQRQPVLVDFYATWCNPCKMLAPVLEAVVQASGGSLGLVKVDTDAHQDLAEQAGVGGIPDVRLYVNGRQIGAFTGFRPRPEVERFVKDRLALAK